LTELGDCIDYSLEENIVKEPPPSFEIISLISRKVKREGKEKDEKCQNGKISFKGKFSKKIDQEITFDLPLSFPQSLIKCSVNKAEKDEEVEVSCKAQKFQKVNSFVIEPRLIKKKHQEILFVKQKKLEFEEFACEDYSTLKYKRAVARQEAQFSYLQLSDFKPSIGNIFEFFFACIKTEISYSFNNLPTFEVHIKKKKKNALRNLADVETEEDEVVGSTCKIRQGYSQSIAAGFDCSGNANDTEGMEIDQDAQIAGLPDPANPDTLPVVTNYSDPASLEVINNLPIVEIKEINGEECEDSGKYTITGEIKSGTLNDTTGVLIPFSSPDSSGLCDIEVNDKNVNMECHNKENFDSSPIIFEQTTIQDSNGKEIFILNKFTNQKSFSCAISVNSSLPQNLTNSTVSPSTSTSTTPSTTSSTPTSSESSTDATNPAGKSNTYRYFNNNDSSGLKGGAIAGIIVAVVAVLAIVTGLAIYCKGNNTKAPIENLSNSSIEKMANYPTTNNF